MGSARFRARSFSILATMALASGMVLATGPAALAAAPSNDTFSDATTAAIGFSEVLDTTQATTDSDDAQLNASCGAPADRRQRVVRARRHRPGVVVDVSQSDYSAGVLVGMGSQGTSTPSRAGRGLSSSRPRDDVLRVAIDDQQDGGGNGGA